MACLILIETELALEVKYILKHCVNPSIKRHVKLVESGKIASINLGVSLPHYSTKPCVTFF